MFNRSEFIRCFSELGKRLGDSSFLDYAIGAAHDLNPMFTPFMQKRALKAIAENYLTEEALENLLSYSDGPEDDINALRREMEGKRVGIIMAGNIPAVGFHDLLCTLSTGARPVVKLSSKDLCLIPAMVDFDEVSSLESALPLDFILFSGSSRTKAIVLDEFEGIPILARGSRFSLGVLNGEETDEDLRLLAEDMFLYGGLGCRSISLLMLPEGFDIQRIIKASSFMRERLMEMGPYKSSYIRRSAIAKIENMFEHGNFTDGGFFILEEARKSFPPMAVVRYSFYKDISEVDEFCFRNRNSIQKKFTNFGMAQSPAIDDWMDGVNTVWSILEGCGVLRKSNG
ncbi:MAG: hypothetical protein IKS82_00945 [Bacteroidales bacterium]|nr:hypothetical protein [Bacteroidales bacterium]